MAGRGRKTKRQQAYGIGVWETSKPAGRLIFIFLPFIFLQIIWKNVQKRIFHNSF